MSSNTKQYNNRQNTNNIQLPEVTNNPQRELEKEKKKEKRNQEYKVDPHNNYIERA